MGGSRKGRGKGSSDAGKSSGKSGSFFGGGGYASFGDYMVEKNRKLKEQFAAAAQAGSEGASKTAIFHGLSFWMTGRTCLPDQELKRIIVEHGGVYEQYGFTHVTHVIADNLASGNQTWAQLKRRTKRVNVVTSNWIMDCVKEGRRIPEIRYMPACLSSASSMLSFMDRSTKEEKTTPDRGSDGVITDDSPQVVDVAASSNQGQARQSHEEPPPEAEVEESPHKKAKQSAGEPAPATSSFALQVSTHCPDGLETFAELVEVLSDLADSSARQLREQHRCTAAAGLRISIGSSAMEWSGTGSLPRAASHSSDILPVLKSLASRAVGALALDSSGYQSVCDVEVRLHCDQPSTGLPPTPELCATEREAEAVDLDAMKPDEHSQSNAGCTDTKDIDIEIGSCASICGDVATQEKDEKAKAEEVQASGAPSMSSRPHWKDLPVWAADVNASTNELMQHWRGICKVLQSMKSSGLRAWHGMAHHAPVEGQVHQPSVTATLACHVDAFRLLVAGHEYEVVHLALRALRISTSKRVPSTLRGEGQLPTEEHFNHLLAMVQQAMSATGVRLKVAPLVYFLL